MRKSFKDKASKSSFLQFIKATLRYLIEKLIPADKTQPIDIEVAQEVQRNAQEVLLQLKMIKEDLRHSVDRKLFIHVEDVVDPIAARIKAVSKRLNTKEEEVHAHEEVHAFEQWMNKKVKPLVDLFANQSNDREAISKAVVQHVVEATAKQIDRDLKVVSDDKYHKISSLDVSVEVKKSLQNRVEKALFNLVKQWYELKEAPKNLNIEHLGVWKAEVDYHRNKFTHIAMEIIDSIIPENEENEETHEHLIENFKEIETLEDALPKLIEEITLEDHNGIDKQRLYKRLAELEHEARQLDLNLSLTPEIEERLLRVRQQLIWAEQLLSITPD